MTKSIYWCGKVPLFDDFGDRIGDTFIDGRTAQGTWAIMTPANHRIWGKGLGNGCGQQYKFDGERWVKQ